MKCRATRVFTGIGALVLLGSAPQVLTAQNSSAFHIDRGHLEGALLKLSEFGRNPDGGVTRLGYSDTELEARKYVSNLMEQAGLTVRVDAVGNLFGRREGTENLPVLLFGSHIDSVVHGGNFDGDVGTLGAIEVIRALNESKVKTRHPLEVAVWENEEGNHFGVSTLGSGVAAGTIGPEILERKDAQGLTLADWLGKYGLDPVRLADARIPKGRLAAYVELHIEQGPTLDAARVSIGVVQGIVGLKRWSCVVTGVANHAGTTPMDRRRDALLAAARDILAVRGSVQSEIGRQVGTVGYVRAEPGAVNVIAGRAEFPVELRDMESEKVERMWSRVRTAIQVVDREENVGTECTPTDEIDPARADVRVEDAIRTAAKSLGLSSMDLPSGAVHDAQQMARIAPMGMIFIPSKDGISHSPKEFSSASDVGNGVEVLYRAVWALDAQFDRQ